MGWTSYYVGGKINRREECIKEIEQGTTNKVVKSVMKGTEFYSLVETKNGRQWCLLILTSVNKGDFYYKDIGLNPYEQGYVVPLSILKSFKPYDDKDKEWLKTQLQRTEQIEQKRKAEPKIELGDVLECRANTFVEWNGGYNLKENEKFFVTVQKVNLYNPKSKTAFIITEKRDTSKINEYVMRPRRIDKKYFTILRVVA